MEDSTNTIEDLEFGLISSLSVFTAVSNTLRVAGYAVTNDVICRADRLMALREALLAVNTLTVRLPMLETELRSMVRHFHPQSELIGGEA